MGKFFFARNYLYLLAPLILIAGTGLSRIARRGTIVLILGLLVLGSVPLQKLDAPTPVDQLLARIDQNVTTEDMVIIGCCVEEPVWYYMTRSGDTGLLNYSPEKERFFCRGDTVGALHHCSR